MHVIPLKQQKHFDLKPGDSLNTLLNDSTKFPAFGLDNNKDGIDDNYGNEEYVIYLDGEGKVFNHENDETVRLNKPVIIFGNGNTLQSQIVVDLPNAYDIHHEWLKAEINELTLKSRAAKTGTGITDVLNPAPNADGSSRVGVMLDAHDITIDGFETGVDMKTGTIVAGDRVQNCGTGINVYVQQSGISISRNRKFINNDIALSIQNTPKHNTNPFTLGYAYCNFIGNKQNIVNHATDIRFNFSFNYYDDKPEDLAGKFKNVRYSPYYQEPIQTAPGKPLTPPVKAYIAPAELTEAATTAIPIARELAGTTSMIQTAGINSKVKFDLVATDAASSKSAGWEFGSMNNAAATAFNPAIETTKLVGGSAAATDKLPAGTTYQPVSFSHHGALPGTASVSVKPTVSVTGTLKLYKVVGNGLELQKDEVKVVNGEYVFNRDSASDYIITGTEVNVPNTEGSGGSTGDSTGSGSDDYISSEDVTQKLNDAAVGAQGTVSLSVSSQPIVGIGAFNALQTFPGKTLQLKGEGYVWYIPSSTVRTIPGLYMVNTAISGTSPNAAQLKKLAGGAVFQSLYFSFHGQLPFVASIEVAVDSKLNGKRLNLYHSIKNNTQLMLVQSGIEVKDGKAMLTGIGSCSDYILTADTIPGALVGTASTSMVNPNTGARDVAPLAMAIALLSGLGAVLLLSDNKKKK